ncbi:hypothetical protein BY458DRAFT_432418 [Sporodiniella umbellata]|nr:hypothetical protein BY458DRAFT_432418 [Sporodiniella umbellata]
MYDQNRIIQSYLDPPCIPFKEAYKKKKKNRLTVLLPRLLFCQPQERSCYRPKGILKKTPRWSIQPRRKRRQKILFDHFTHVHTTYSALEYDRTSDTQAVCTRLTPLIAQQIKQELNHFKLYEMPVHDASKDNTHFFN